MVYKKLKYWFDKALAVRLSDKIQALEPAFNASAFTKAIADGVEDLELKDRVGLFADQLQANLPADFPAAMSLLLKILPPENEKETGMFSEYYWIMPFAAFVERHGLNHFNASMAAIKEITKRNTGEYCIRPFIEKYPQKTLSVMLKWSKDSNVHVRRLASEGVRPRLPWAKKLDMFIHDPRPILKIVENLKDDASRFVQKSVANNLNDILKDNYDIGMRTIKKWSKGAASNRRWIIRHALRNRIKQGDTEAQNIVGGFN